MSHSVLIADVGGTSARLALVGTDGIPTDIRICRNDDFASLEALVEADLAARGTAPSGAVLAVAGPADSDFVKLTNRAWSFSQAAMRRRFGWKSLTILNDYGALAHAAPALAAGDLVAVGGGRADAKAPIVVCGPGTGFGVGALIRSPRTPVAVTGEGGLCRLGASTAEEARLIAHLVRDLGPVAVEHALSGAGLARIHTILTGETLTPEAVIVQAKRGDTATLETCHVFLRLFGRIAGDLALIFDARGGVFLAGGVSAALAPLIAASPFREAFEEHPPHTARLAATPVQAIIHPTPGLVGAGQVAARMARKL
ncbi:MAG TPA: glucokinase [Xanthobacteraceae bacterium]|nr:glucokinase [Xanthobacteraceae bacterium]